MHIGIQRDRKIDIDMCVCVFVHELVLLHMYACICLFIHLGHDLLINVFVDSFIYWSIYVLCVYLFTVTFSFYVHYCRLSCAGTCRSRKSTSQGSLALDSKLSCCDYFIMQKWSGNQETSVKTLLWCFAADISAMQQVEKACFGRLASFRKVRHLDVLAHTWSQSSAVTRNGSVESAHPADGSGFACWVCTLDMITCHEWTRCRWVTLQNKQYVVRLWKYHRDGLQSQHIAEFHGSYAILTGTLLRYNIRVQNEGKYHVVVISGLSFMCLCEPSHQ
jgi:hypothetical protein